MKMVPCFRNRRFFSVPSGGSAAVLLLLLVLVSARTSSAEPEAAFSFEIEPGSETFLSVPVHRPVAFEGEVLEIAGRTITFTGRFCEPNCNEISPYDVVSVSDGFTVVTGSHAGVRGRVLWADDRSVVVEPNVDLSGISPGDVVRITPGWTLDSLFPAGTPDRTQVLLFESRPQGINLAASSIYEYYAFGDFWYDVVTSEPAGEVVIHETETLLVRDPRSAGGFGEAYSLILSGEVSALIPRVDLGVRPRNAPQEVHFGVPQPVTLGNTGMGGSGDRIYVMPESGGSTPVSLYVYFENFGWYEGSENVDNRELEPGRVYVYRRLAPEPRDIVSTFSLLVQKGNFLGSEGVPVPNDSAFGILVDTTGEGFDPGQFRPFPSLVRGDRPVFLKTPNGVPTGVAFVYVGTFSAPGYIGGVPGIRHATGGGVAETGDRWGIVWFHGVPVGATPKAWRPMGFYTNENMTIPEPGRTVSYSDVVSSGLKHADYLTASVEFDSFDAWTTAHFYADERENPERMDPAGDPERSGAPNLMRYAFDLDPRRPVSMGGLPTVTTGVPSGGTERYQVITYRRFLDADDLAYRVQASEDFQNWTDLAESQVVSVESVDGERHELVTVRDTEPVRPGQGRFLRVVVTRD